MVSYHIISYHIISYHIISYHIISYHIISYRIISYRIISYEITSHHILAYPSFKERIALVNKFRLELADALPGSADSGCATCEETPEGGQQLFADLAAQATWSGCLSTRYRFLYLCHVSGRSLGLCTQRHHQHPGRNCCRGLRGYPYSRPILLTCDTLCPFT